MIDYDETTELKATAAAATEDTYRALDISLSSSSSGSGSSSSDSTGCCTPPSPAAGLPIVSVADLSRSSNHRDRHHHQQQQQQQHAVEKRGGLRRRRQQQQYQGETIFFTDMTPALLQQSVRQRGSGNHNNAGASSSAVSSVTATPPESPLSLIHNCNGEEEQQQQEATLDEDRFLLPQSAMSSSHAVARGDSSSAARRHRFWIQTIWMVNLAVSVAVILISVASNQDSRKYIIIDPHKVGDATCKRVFLNVMASSPDEKDAIICCEPLKSGGGKRKIPKISQQELEQQQQQQHEHPLWINQHVLNREDDIYTNADNGDEDSDTTTTTSWTTTTSKRLRQQFLDICPQPRATRVRLPFVNRLAKFPDAWLLPLFPLLIRMCLRLYQSYLEPESPTPSPQLSSSSSSSVPSRYFYDKINRGSGGGGDTTFGIYTFRRLLLYFMIMLFRGAFLFMALNGIEDQIARYSPPTTRTSGDGKPSSCWYSSLLNESQPGCYGRIFDFSDHIVLYFAQLLPIALLEYLHSLERPYWPFRCFRKRAMPVLLTLAMLYLYTLVFVGVYKTASYFHTTSEIIAGFCVSLIAMLPLGWVQCSESPRGRALRFFFFGRTDPPRCYSYEKLSPSISASSLTPMRPTYETQ